MTTDTRAPYWEFVEHLPSGHKLFKKVTFTDGGRDADMGVRYIADNSGLNPDLTDDPPLAIIPWHSEIRFYNDGSVNGFDITVQAASGDWYATPIGFPTAALLSSRDGYKVKVGDQYFKVVADGQA